MTLRELAAQHPEWLDLPIVVYTEDNGYEYVGASATVYADDKDLEPGSEPVLVFAPN